MWLNCRCSFKFDIQYPTPFVLMLRPRSGSQQWIGREEYTLSPSVPAFEFTDDYGNLCQRLMAQPGEFTISTSTDVMTSDSVDEAPQGYFVEVQKLPDSVLKYLLPSRYCESDRFGEMGAEITSNQRPGYDQAQQIENWLRDNIEYAPGSSNYPVSATEVNAKKSGVCRDLAHLGIALSRSINLPARMVVGYLYGLTPMDLHAWYEVFVADRWYIFDATQKVKCGGYIALGFGRDAADVAVFNQFGPAVAPKEQIVSVTLIDVPSST
jgi:transglutaminase-like putative cysteine protease